MTCIGTRKFTVYTERSFLSFFFIAIIIFSFIHLPTSFIQFIFSDKNHVVVNVSSVFQIHFICSYLFDFHCMWEKMSMKIVLHLQKNIIFNKRIGNLVISICITFILWVYSYLLQ